MTLALVLAAVLGAGRIPIPSSIMAFPDPSPWPGLGLQQEANMLLAIVGEGGEEVRSFGPGPQQLAARWSRGQLNAAERVAVLLAGATYHDPVLLPAYVGAFRARDMRERKAAATGLAWLLGLFPPPPSAITDDPATWQRLATAAEAFVAAARTRTLVGIWVDSYLEATHQPRRPGLVFGQSPDGCLGAIREVAEPDDLDELVALWPLLATQGHRYDLMRTIEMITMQRFVLPPQGSRRVTGEYLYAGGVKVLDKWISGICGSQNGEGLFRHHVLEQAQSLGRAGDGSGPQPWFGPLLLSYPVVWAIPAERLIAFGAPAVSFDRQRPENPANAAAVQRLREFFAISGQ